MKYSIILLFLIFNSCNSIHTSPENKIPYNTKGFALIISSDDKMHNKKKNIFYASTNKLRFNALIKIINPETQESIILKNNKKIKYPEFYKILINDSVAKKLNLNKDLPLVEVLEIKKNKSFVAKKAKIFKEERQLSSNAPVASVKISNISKNKLDKKKEKKEMYILIATFYSKDTALFLKDRIKKEIPSFDINKLIVKEQSNRKIDLFSGPYNAINLVKNDYIQLKKFGFEELEVTFDD